MKNWIHMTEDSYAEFDEAAFNYYETILPDVAQEGHDTAQYMMECGVPFDFDDQYDLIINAATKLKQQGE